MKKGYQTSEFWVNVVGSIITLLLASGVIPVGSVWNSVVAIIVTGLIAYGYNGGRALIKSSK